MKTTKQNKTNILLLRWLSNWLNNVGIRSLVRAFDLQEDNNLGTRYKLHCKVYHYCNKPYERWGTYYSVDLDGDNNDN
jgi:hypothetical protein